MSKYGYYKYFPISHDFCTLFLLANLWPIQLGIIANIDSRIMNYHSAKLYENEIKHDIHSE